MKRLQLLVFSVIGVLIFCLGLVKASAQTPVPTTVQLDPSIEFVGFTKAYVPDGFDSRNNVQFVGEGKFGNFCYRPSAVNTKIDQEHHIITVSPTAFKYSGLCLQVVLPFSRTIEVGTLKPGKWTIVSFDGTKLGEIPVKLGTHAEADEYNYAPVSQAYVEAKEGKAHVTLSGNMPNNCMHIKELRTHLQPDVLVVQPITEFDTSDRCIEGAFPYTQSVDVAMPAKGRFLLHIRSMNGNAVNSLFDNN